MGTKWDVENRGCGIESDPISPLAETRWYAVYTAANHEKKAAAEFARRCVEFFLPLYSSVRRWQDRRVKLERPLFPGYLFVHLALQERLRVLQVPGVVRLVSFGNTAAPVPDAEIERIRSILNQGVRTEPHPYMTRGRQVRVTSGPLAGLEGIIVRRKKGYRFVVSISLIQRAVAVEICESDLEPVKSESSRSGLLSAHG
jgi:transcription antitermination factor NusG